MKKILTLAGMGLVVVSAVFMMTASATSTSSRYRGSTYEEFEQYKKRLGSSSGRIFRRFSRAIRTQTSDREARSRAEESRTLSRRSLGQRLRLSLNGGAQRTLRIRGMFKTFSASKIPFYVTLPRSFEIESDSLDWDSGAFVLKTARSRVELSATGERCDGGPTFVRSCLREKIASITDELKQKFPNAFIIRNEAVTLRASGITRFEKDNMGRLFILSTRAQRFGVLTFFDPVNELVWHLQMESPDRAGSVLNNNAVLRRVLESLFQEPIIRPIVRSRVRYEGRRSNVRRRQRMFERYSSKETKVFRASEVPFAIELPKEFQLKSDNLQFDTGKMVIQSLDSLVEITAAADMCDSQTRSLVRRCVEKHARIFSEQLQTEFPEASVLSDENLLLRLTNVAASKEYVGRFFLMRDVRKRVANLTFSDPIQNHVWTIRIESPISREALLSDIRKTKKMFSSMMFLVEKE